MSEDVQRYAMQYGNNCSDCAVEADAHGDYVRYDDYADLRTQLAAARAELKNTQMRLNDSEHHNHMVTQTRIEWEMAAERYEAECEALRHRAETAEQRATYEADVAAQAIARAETAERERDEVLRKVVMAVRHAEKLPLDFPL